MISEERAEEIAARYRAAGAQGCTALDVMKFLGSTMAEREKLEEIRLRFGLRREDLFLDQDGENLEDSNGNR